MVVDEAHNLRSDKRRDHRVLSEYIADNDSRALLLTATPYNKGLADLASQLSLFVRADTDLGVRPERAIAEAGEAEFELSCNGSTSTLAAFKKSGHLGDWQALMSQYLVRRTRRFVQDNYAFADTDGRRYLQFGPDDRFYFPKRTAVPIDRAMAEDDPARVMSAEETLDSIQGLRLPRYQMGDHIRDGFEPSDPAQRQTRARFGEISQGQPRGIHSGDDVQTAVVVGACVHSDAAPSPAAEPGRRLRARQ